ncbi:TfoX/Sxy family protein [uncultured Shimia sp.]|uniref:TfoX/Sxy family protein n=1 Tax=uncultured Shimia sp. TaxID=573152 RepID=UPI00260DC3BC|nr:TfoX/Sxy family protein [uncultured Shimia sp.]
MAYDEGLAHILRDDLTEVAGIEEKKMFGGLCFMLNGNILCGVHKGGGMFRVGKDNEVAALAINGVSPLAFTGKKMGGMLDVDEDLMADDGHRAQVLGLAMNFVGNLPAK